ncbi:MAG: helix-turn-helix domain-containing protein [Phycisphaerales bacterium]|nr:helix-turn-helix domain-containing protein [Phycisphaerales bacterium]
MPAPRRKEPTFADNFRAERARIKISIREFAKQLRVPAQVIVAIEAGHVLPAGELLDRLNAAFQIDVRTLFPNQTSQLSNAA